jgi:type VI secretion system protein ImpM
LNKPSKIPGCFGKAPSHSGFLCLRLSTSFVQTWENWLQASLRTSQRVLDDRWLDIYLSSPIWRFIIQANVCGAHAWTGVLMPSVDGEGHYFPLTLATCIHVSQAREKLFQQAENWFLQLEQIALSALSDDVDIAQLDLSLQDLPPLRAQGSLFWHHLGLKNSTGNSYWRVSGYDQDAPGVKAFKELPRPVDFVTLLNPHTPRKTNDHTVPAPSTRGEDAGSERTEAVCHQSAAPSKPHQTPLRWRSWALTDVGMRREINEDAFLNKPEAGMWVVADGMGGHSAGDVASRTVTRRLEQSACGDSLANLEQHTRATLQAVNAELLELAAQMGPGHVVGTTVVALLAAGDACAALWAGDSRLYRHRDGTLKQLTVDHSMAVEMAKAHNALPDGYGDNIVTRALGADPLLELDRVAFKARPGDHYLLCSDGLTKEIHSSEIEAIFNSEEEQQGLRRMVDLALERQARDNITAILVSAEPA